MTTREASFDYARLRELAEKATPGPWEAGEPEIWDEIPQASVNADGAPITWDDHSGEVFKPEDAEFIAAFNPETAKALLDEIERLRGQVDSMQMANDMLRATHKTDNQYLLDEIERLRGEGDWEYQGVPIYEDGGEAAGRSIEACREWIESDADPNHWIHDERNWDLPAVVSYRVERRRPAGPWERVPEGGER